MGQTYGFSQCAVGKADPYRLAALLFSLRWDKPQAAFRTDDIIAFSPVKVNAKLNANIL